MNTIYHDWQLLNPQNTKENIDEDGNTCASSFFSGDKESTACHEAKKRAAIYCRINNKSYGRFYCASKKAGQMTVFEINN